MTLVKSIININIDRNMKNLKAKLCATLSAVALCALMPSQADAQITVVPENDNFSLKLIGRTNLDAGTFIDEQDDDSKPNNGVAVNDNSSINGITKSNCALHITVTQKPLQSHFAMCL